MDVFVSHSRAESKLAKRLSDELKDRGLSVWFDCEIEPGGNWRNRIEEAIRDADHVLLLISRREPDEIQQLTWRTALEAVWEDPEKRLIPVLHRGADLPAFVLSGSPGSEIQALRLGDPQNLHPVIDAIVKIVRGEHEDHKTTRSFVVDGGDEGKEPSDRSARLHDIRRRLISGALP